MKTLASFLFGLLCITVIALGLQIKTNQAADPNILTYREMTIEQAEQTFNIQIQVPTIREIQRMVGAEQDGIVGLDTLDKWGIVVGNQFAKEYFK